MITFQKVKLGDIAEITMGQSPESKYYNKTGEGLPFFQGVTDFGEKYPIETTWTTYSNKIANVKDILFSVRAPVGEINIAKKKSALGRGVCAIKSINNQGEFLYFLLRANIKKIVNIANGAIYDSINKPMLEKFEFNVPNLLIQTRIGSILFTYDDLIENNEKRIKALEEMAQLLYTEWFVKFKFPGHEKVKMVDSGKKYGMIPEKWEIKKLRDICTRIQAGGTPLRSNSIYWHNGTINWYTTGELQDSFLFNSEEQITETAILKTSAKLFDKGTILMAIYGSPTVGRLGRATDRCSCNQAAIGIIQDNHKVGENYVWYALKKLRIFFNAIASGVAQLNISKEIVADADILIAPKYLIDNFEFKTKNIWSKIEILSRKNNNLSQTRDLLIPQLVTGKRELK